MMFDWREGIDRKERYVINDTTNKLDCNRQKISFLVLASFAVSMKHNSQEGYRNVSWTCFVDYNEQI